MSIISLDAARISKRHFAPRIKSIDVLAAKLVNAGYIYGDRYLEMKHLDPKWMVAVRIYWLALHRAFGGKPNPVSNRDRD